MNQLITILGPTASGKTKLAAHLADAIDAEIISADSRQIYKGLDIGSGKDLTEYVVDGRPIAYHLIDHCTLDEEYNIFRFQQDFHEAYQAIIEKNKPAILCGGTGLYLQTVLDGYKLYPVPKDEAFINELEAKDQDELVAILKDLAPLHNSTDTQIKSRTIRAIEIARYCTENNISMEECPALESKTFGISIDRTVLMQRITDRLNQRIEEGMIDEVKGLLDNGVTIERLRLLGLEYRFIAEYLHGEMSYAEMFERLNIAIRQFAKRQMTWFRRMEKQGHQIHWLDGEKAVEENVAMIKKIKRS